MCRPLTRRELLRYGALVAATPLVARWDRPARAFAQTGDRAVPMNLELVTLTESSAVLTWFTGDPTKLDQYHRPEPVPADTVVELGTSPATMATVVQRDDNTPYHYVELTGLEPGRPYFYRCLSSGLPATPALTAFEPAATGTFTTLLPPPGKFLFAMAWLNDLHIGEMTSGLAISNSALPGGGFPPGFPVDPHDPYWRVMAHAAVDEAKARGAGLMLVNGDLTSEAQPIYLSEARATLDVFGTYRRDYFVTRGNHDRAHKGPDYTGCRPAAGASGYEDCLLDHFFPDGNTYFSFDHLGVHMVGLDTNNLTTGDGAITPEQFTWLEADLAAHSGRPTFVFGHHPVSEEAAATALPPVTFSLNRTDAQRLESLVASHAVVGVYNGHTHRNKRTASVLSPGVPYVELGAVKEYPGGYGLVRVHEGGYAVNFYKTKADGARAWSERSRGEYLGLYPYYTLGTLGDRNFVVTADLSDAARTHPITGAAAPPQPPGGNGTTAATGTPGWLAPAGIATGAAALAARRARDSGG
jgi:3',5'-cyclic AMP phosphodiesterase CpdA